MRRNLSDKERVFRAFLGVVMLIILFTSNLVTGTFFYILIAGAVIFIGTSLFSFCPLYYLFGKEAS